MKKFYSVGQRFFYRSARVTYLLCITKKIFGVGGGKNYVQLVNLNGTSYWESPVSVKDPKKITEQEFEEIAGRRNDLKEVK